MASTVALTTLQTIADIEDAFGRRLPSYPAFVNAFLYPSGERSRVVVRVPVKAASGTVTVDTVDYMVWIATDAAHPISNLSFLDLEVSVGHAGATTGFTVFAPDQETPFGVRGLEHPFSRYVAATMGPVSWRGNVLVMRRELGSGRLVDVRDSDAVNADNCVSGMVRGANMRGIVG
ncbi:hypothetical protein DFH06DRAFT_1135697 [Mycena polygramma]|nr:hypothetical protein DFH06DRAFT_1135697 [Mycena polygramma]